MLFPVALNIEGRSVLVVGGGAVAARKVASLLECGAVVTVISPGLASDFPSPVEHRARAFETGDCLGYSLVFAATNRREVNALVEQEAKANGIWCNLADAPAASDFHTTSVVRRGEITVGISTQGVSPVLARHVRERIEAAVGEEYAALIQIAGELDVPTAKRGDFWRRALASDVLEILRAGRVEEVRHLLGSLLAEVAHKD